MALAAHAAAVVLIGGCGAQVVIEESDETEPASPATSAPETPDPCAAFTTRASCCDAGCRLIPEKGSLIACLSEDRDGFLNPAICEPEERCELHDTSGNGGCSYGFDIDTVGRCVPR